MNKTKILKITFFMILILFIASCTQSNPVSREVKQPVKIGVILPLTGAAQNYGQSSRDAIELAFEEINSESPDTIRLIFEDSKCDPKEGVSAYSKLVNIDDVKIIIGDLCSPVTLSFVPLAQKDEVLVITPASAAPSISSAGDYIFRNHITQDKKTGELAEFASKKYKRIAILYDQSNDAFLTGKDMFLKECKDQIVETQSFKKGDTDFRTQLLKIKTKNPDAIYIGSLMPELALIIKQIKELKIDSQILTDDGVLESSFLSALNENANDIIFGTTKFSREDSPEFFERFEAKYGRLPTIFDAQSFDTLKILFKIIKEDCKNKDQECIKNALYTIKYSGAAGLTEFDENGDAEREVVLKIIKNGEFITLY